MGLLNPPPVGPSTFGTKADTPATSDSGTFSFIALFKRALASLTGINNILTTIGSSTDPVPVSANLKNGNYVLSSIGSPSISTLAANQVIYSTPFTPSGELVTIKAQEYKTGGIVLGPDASYWLECDPAGGGNYAPVDGTLRLFSDGAVQSPFYPSIAIVAQVRGGNWRLGINMGTVTGTATGTTGFNVTVLN